MHCAVILIIFVGTVQCANILGVFMYPSISHQTVFQQIWRELSLRGHQVTVVTPNPLNDPTLTNLTEISVDFVYDELKKYSTQDMASMDLSRRQVVKNIYFVMDVIAENVLRSTQVQELIRNTDKKIDLILISTLMPVMYAFVDRFKAPSIVISSMSVDSSYHDAVGNTNHPILYPDPYVNIPSGQLTLWQKLQSVRFFLWNKHHYHNIVVPRAYEMAKEYFGTNVSYIGDLERNVSMFFVYTNRLIHDVRSNVPGAIEIGPRSVEPPKPLPKDLQQILNEATQGVIYFSLGSNVKSIGLKKKLRSIILQALSELPYTVLWKWEADTLPGKTSNIITRRWFPQKDVLAHPNIKAFVTQGGLQSLEEAISAEVPLIGMPFMGEQPLNVHRIVELGIGKRINCEDLTSIKLKDAIIQVAENKAYKDRIKEARCILFDRSMSGLESAVWWSEYIIRHKGARHLRSPTINSSCFQYVLVDVIMVLIAGVLVIGYITYKLVTKILKLYKKRSQRRHDNNLRHK